MALTSCQNREANGGWDCIILPSGSRSARSASDGSSPPPIHEHTEDTRNGPTACPARRSYQCRPPTSQSTERRRTGWRWKNFGGLRGTVMQVIRRRGSTVDIRLIASFRLRSSERSRALRLDSARRATHPTRLSVRRSSTGFAALGPVCLPKAMGEQEHDPQDGSGDPDGERHEGDEHEAHREGRGVSENDGNGEEFDRADDTC